MTVPTAMAGPLSARQPEPSAQQQRPGAFAERAHFISELHLARVLQELRRDELRRLGIHTDLLVERGMTLSGIQRPSEVDLAKTWFLCDTNLFLRYQFFDQVDWREDLAVNHAVLVLPVTTQRELDKHKSDPRDREANSRACQVLSRLRRLALAHEPGASIQLKPRVELLPLAGDESVPVRTGSAR